MEPAPRVGRQRQRGPREPCAVLGQKCTWSQEHLLQTPINPTGGYLVHIVVPSHARVAECLVEGHWEVWGVEASTREVFKQILWGVSRQVTFPIGLSVGCVMPLPQTHETKMSLSSHPSLGGPVLFR